MRTRRWILIIALFIAFTALVIYHGWSILNVNERIKEYMITTLGPVLVGELDINRLSMSLGAVHLKNVEINNDDYVLNIEDVRIGFSFANLAKNSFRLQKIPQDILFIKPHLMLRKHLFNKSHTISQDSLHREISEDSLWKKIKEIDFIKRITISKGRISYIDSIDEHNFQFAHDVNGWLNSKGEESVSTRLVGKLFQSRTFNLLITANINAIQERLDLLDVKVTNYEWKDKIPILIPDYFEIKQGTFDGAITLVDTNTVDNGLDIQGYISIKDGKFFIANKRLNFENIYLNTKIESLNCVVENSSFVLNGSHVDIKGKINNILSPRLDLTLKSNRYDLNKNLSYLSPKSKINLKGNCDFSIHVTNTYKSPIIGGELLSQQVKINDRTIQQIRADVSLENSEFKISEFSGKMAGLDLVGSGSIDFFGERDSLSFNISSSGELSNGLVKLPFRSLENSLSQLKIQGDGNLAEIHGSFDCHLKSASQVDTTFQVTGDFEFKDKKLWLQCNSLSHPFRGDFYANFASKRPQYRMRLTDSHNLLYNLPEFKLVKKIFNYKTSTIEMRGGQDDWRLTGSCAWNGKANRTANMTGRMLSQNENQEIEAKINIHSGGEKFFSKLNLIKTPDYWELKKINIENLFDCEGLIYSRGKKEIEGSIIINNSYLSGIESLVFDDNKSVNQGKLSGFIGFSGTLENPQISGNFELTEMMLNQIGFYDATISFQLIDHQFEIDQFHMTRNQQPVFQCKGMYQVDSDQLNVNLTGQDIDLSSLMTTVLNKPAVLTGKGSSNLQLRGGLKRPKIYGEVEIENGQLGPFSFDHVKLDLGDENDSKASPFVDSSDSTETNGLRLKNILITRIGQFEMYGSGIVPYSGQNMMDVELKGEGNILSILPELTHFFKETKSSGKWRINFSGRPNNLTVSNGELLLSDGYLNLKDVAPEIKNINANLQLEQDGFLNVKFISGEIKGKSFTFKNFRPDSTMESFSIPEYGLDFGIFTLRTLPRGIPLHIPGLMRKGEIGSFAFKGRNEYEQFYFAGPIEHPVVRGRIQLQNINFTFPFIGNNSADTLKAKPFLEVLKNINWNVYAVVGKDLHYQREIPSGVDNVYVDLIVDVGVGGLEFNGIINDNSFGVTGILESSRGYVEYLDLDFEVMKAGVEFDMDVSKNPGVEFDKSTLLPIVYGEARTTVIDSTGYPYYVYLTLFTVDDETGHKRKRGRFGEVVFHLSADNPNLGYTEGELLASLGYSVSNISKVATDLIGISTDNLLFRPLFRPFERQLERTLGLDMVRFSSRFTRNLIEMNIKDEQNFQFNSKLFLLRSTKLMVGKYIAQRLFLLYTGQLEAGMDYRYQQEGFGFRHTLGLEYRINPSLLLQMEYDYDSLLLWQREDKKVMLRHSFPF